jgi:hypothetical protein
MSADGDALLAQIIADHGGRERFDATALAVAARLAAILSSDGDGTSNTSAATIAALCTLLPSKPSATEPQWNLALLTDAELATLDKLCAKAMGELPPSVEKPRRHPRRSPREVWAAYYAIAIDAIEAEQDDARREGRPWSLSPDDRQCWRTLQAFGSAAWRRPRRYGRTSLRTRLMPLVDE